MIRNSVGKTVALDARSSLQIHQVRICVEVDVSGKLPPQILVNKRRLQVLF